MIIKVYEIRILWYAGTILISYTFIIMSCGNINKYLINVPRDVTAISSIPLITITILLTLVIKGMEGIAIDVCP